MEDKTRKLADSSEQSFEIKRSLTSILPKISSLPNLRAVCQHQKNKTGEAPFRSQVIYRSSKPDRLLYEDLDEFRKLGIKCIIDFRSVSEYMGTDGHRPLDSEYPIYKVKIPAKCQGIVIAPSL